jgi:hypothetical protein
LCAATAPRWHRTVRNGSSPVSAGPGGLDQGDEFTNGVTVHITAAVKFVIGQAVPLWKFRS